MYKLFSSVFVLGSVCRVINSAMSALLIYDRLNVINLYFTITHSGIQAVKVLSHTLVGSMLTFLQADIMTPYKYGSYNFAVAKRLRAAIDKAQNVSFWSQSRENSRNSPNQSALPIPNNFPNTDCSGKLFYYIKGNSRFCWFSWRIWLYY